MHVSTLFESIACLYETVGRAWNRDGENRPDLGTTQWDLKMKASEKIRKVSEKKLLWTAAAAAAAST